MANQPTTSLIMLLAFLAVFPQLRADSIWAGSNVLFSGEILKSGYYIGYKNNAVLYSLVMQEDCNLVTYTNGKPTWASNTWHKGTNCYLQLQSNGELVVYGWRSSSLAALWRSGSTSEFGTYVLVVRFDGHIHVYGWRRWSAPIKAGGADRTAGAAVSGSWPSTNDSVLYTGDVAPIGPTIVNGNYELVLQRDCNLAARDKINNVVLWETGSRTNIEPHTCFVEVEGDGQLRVKYLGGDLLWENKVTSSPQGEYVLALGPQGQLGVYGPTLWDMTKKGVALPVWGSAENNGTLVSDE